MAHEVKYRYRAHMPIDGTSKIVHIEALTSGVTYRFVAFEKGSCALCVIGVRNAPDDALHLRTSETNEKTIKSLLASFNHGYHYDERLDEIEIIVGGPVRGRRGGIPDSREYGNSRRSTPHSYPFTDEPAGNRWDKVGR